MIEEMINFVEIPVNAQHQPRCIAPSEAMSQDEAQIHECQYGRGAFLGQNEFSPARWNNDKRARTIADSSR